MSVMPSNPSPTPSTSSTPSTPSARSPYKSTYLWGLPNHADPLDARSSGVARRISVQQHMIPEVFTVSSAAAAFKLPPHGDEPFPSAPAHLADRLAAAENHVDAPLPFFEGLQPLVYFVAFFGFAPIGFKPLRVSFDFRNSTLGYALCVQGFVLWSVYLTLLGRLNALEDMAEEQADEGGLLDDGDWKKQFLAFTAIVHSICWIVTPLVWLESPRTRDTDARCRQFMQNFGCLLDTRITRADHRKAWVTAVVCDLIVGTLAIVWWMMVVETSLKPVHCGAHLYSNALVSHAATVFWFVCHRVRHIASALAAQLQREIDGGVLSPERVHDFQRGWERLCALNVDIVATPISLSVLIVFILVLVTFNTYSALSRVGANLQVTAAIVTVIIPHFTALFLLYHSAHQSARTIRNSFMQILQKPRWPIVDERTENELQKFIEVVRWNSPVVSVGGHFELTTSSFNAVIAAITTYVIVIMQLQLGLPTEPINASTIAMKTNSCSSG